MHRLRLVSARFINPAWFHLPEQVAVAFDTNTVKAYGETLALFDPNEITLSPGEKVYVWLSNNFYLETDYERIERARKIQISLESQRQTDRARANAKRREAEEFNASLHVPVSWITGIKDVLSGLSANSWGDGRNTATVDHILLLEDLHDGRLIRHAGDFLCTTEHGSNGKQWRGTDYDQRYMSYDADNQPYHPKVTCKACIKIVQRWKDA